MILKQLTKAIKTFFSDEPNTFIGVTTHDRDLGNIELAAVPRSNVVWYRRADASFSYPVMVFIHEADGKSVVYSNINNLKVETKVAHKDFTKAFTHVSPRKRDLRSVA